MNKFIQKAEALLKQAKNMHNYASTKQWRELESLQQEHKQATSQLDQEPLPESNLADARTILLQIKELNNQTSQLAEQQRCELVAEQKKINKAEKMKKALNAFK